MGKKRKNATTTTKSSSSSSSSSNFFSPQKKKPTVDDDNDHHDQDELKDRRKESSSTIPSTSTTSSSPTPTPTWGGSSSYEFSVDYNDHFETPLIAYQDILPLLLNCITKNKNKNDIILYDPYYCNGRTKILLTNQLGFNNVIHEKRDFYKDIINNTIPNKYNILITNPPYSDDHKQRCIQFCIQQYKLYKKPFFLLMPNYITTKQYYKELIGDNMLQDIVYVVPSESYRYDHPEGTGYTISPFDSLWYCCIGRDNVSRIQKEFEEYHNNNNNNNKTTTTVPPPPPPLPSRRRANLFKSIQELENQKIISTICRPNPRQRKKRKKQQLQQQQQQNDDTTASSFPQAAVAASGATNHPKTKQNITKQTTTIKGIVNNDSNSPKNSTVKKKNSNKKKKQKSSRYRDEHGNRIKTRF